MATDYRALVTGLVAEFETSTRPSQRVYEQIVRERRRPEQEEAVLLKFAAYYWAVRNYGVMETRRSGSGSLRDFGLVGETLSFFGEVAGTAWDLVVDTPLQLLTDHTSGQLYEKARACLSSGEGNEEEALLSLEQEVIQELRGLGSKR